MQKLKDELNAVVEERNRYKREVEQGGGEALTRRAGIGSHDSQAEQR